MVIEVSVQFVFGLIVGMVVGAVISHLAHKKNINVNIEKSINILLILVWLGMTVYGFAISKEVPAFFNFVGGCSVGNLVGFDFVDLYTKMIKGKR